MSLQLHDALSDEEAARIKDMMSGLVRATREDLPEPRTLDSFVAAIQRSLVGVELEYEVLPQSDVRIEILTSDQVMTGGYELLHPFARISDETLASLRSNLMQVYKQNPEDVLKEVHRFVAAGAHAEAIAAVRDSGRHITPDFALFKALHGIRAEVLSVDDRAYLLRVRWQAACAARQFGAAAEDAGELLRTGDLPEDALSLRMTQALAAHESGRNETAVAILREILASPDLTDVKKGWALRNLAKILGSGHEEFEALCRSSADAFLAGGQRVEATSSLLNVVNKQLFDSPVDALSLLDELETWFDAAEPLSQELRASLLHLRGDALRRLRRPGEALAAARTAVELRRGPMFVEEQLASSLCLAAYAAEDLGLMDEAATYSHEVEQIEVKIRGDQPTLEQRVIDLAKKYDPEEANAVVKRAQEVGNWRVAANAMMLIATSDPKLSAVDRLELLERAVEELRRNHRDDEDMASVYLAIALELTRQKEYDRALDWYKKVFDINPLTVELCPNYPVLLLKKERWSELAGFATDQIKRSGETVEMLYFHGRALAGLGQPEQALLPLVRAQGMAAKHPLAPTLTEWIAKVAQASSGTLSPKNPPHAGRSSGQTARKVLFVAASPAGSARLRFDVEFRKIMNETRDASPGLEMIPLLAAQPGDIERSLLDHHPAIFHFAGHATDAGLQLQDDVDEATVATYDWLAAGLAAIGGIECVVLNACQTLAGAPRLSRVARYVIGLPTPWGDRDAVEFAHAFYLAVSRATSVPRAFELARERVASRGVLRDDLPRLVERGVSR